MRGLPATGGEQSLSHTLPTRLVVGGQAGLLAPTLERHVLQ